MAVTLYDFDDGVIGQPVATGGGITDVAGATYQAGFHGTGIRYTDSGYVDFAGITSGTHSGSVYMQSDSNIASGGSRGLLLKTALSTWRSGWKFISDGDLDPTIGATNQPAITTWAQGDQFRFDWQYNATTHQIIWRVFKNANVDGTTHDFETTLDLSGNTDPITFFSFGAPSSSPAGTDMMFDTLRVSDQLEWLAPYAPPASGGLRVGSTPATAVYVGGTLASRVYAGSEQVWP